MRFTAQKQLQFHESNTSNARVSLSKLLSEYRSMDYK